MVVQDSHVQGKSYRITLARSATVTTGTYQQFLPETSYLGFTTNERRGMSLVKSVDSWQGCNFVELKKTKKFNNQVKHTTQKLGYSICTPSASYEKS